MIDTLLARFQKLPTIYVITIFCVVTFFCYFVILGNGLFYDDEFFIYNNVYVQHFSITNFFTQNVDAGGGVLSNYYRPLLLTLFSLTYQIFGNTGGPYHLLSILFHLSSGVGVFFVFRKFSSKSISFLTALFFLIHPIQTESIAYASGISDPMYVTFVMVTLFSFLNHTKRSVLLTPFLFFVALLSKESAFITLGLMPLVAWMKEQSFSVNDYKKYVPAFLGSVGVFLGYGLLRLTILNFENTLNFLNDNSVYATHLYARLLTFVSILPTYISLLLYPQTLFIDRVADVVTTLNPYLILTLLALFTLLIGGILTYKKFPALLFSFLWFFISIMPMSGITPINGIIYEHFLYLPSIGFFFLLINIFALLYKKVTTTKYSSIGLTAITLIGLFSISALCLRTIVRNAEWNSPFTLYPQLLEHNPRSVRALTNYAMALANSGREKESIPYYQRALAVQDTFPQERYNLGNSYRALGEYAQAEAAYQQTIQKYPSFYQAYQSLYGVYVVTNQTKKASQLLAEIKQKGETDSNLAALYRYITQQK